MAFDGLFVDDLALAAPPLMGDFYSEPDDVCRGITLGSGVAFDGIGGPWSSDLQGCFACDASDKPAIAPSRLGNSQEQGRRFREFYEPRRVPEDPFFFLEKTTRYVMGASSAKAGNSLLDFFEQEIRSSITKVNEKKFSIKAEAFHNGRPCVVKVNIYQQDSGCAVEFQRREGDGITFMGIYEKASRYLNEHTSEKRFQQNPEFCDPSSAAASLAAIEQHALPCPVPATFTGEDAEESSLTMWLHVARQDHCLRDEIVSNMLGMVEAEEPKILDCLCKPETLELLIDALSDGSFLAAYPAARLLARASDLAEARSCLLAQGLVKAVISKLWVQATGKEVWFQLAHAVLSFTLAHAAYMTSTQRQDLASSVADALDLEPCEGGACASRQLREAQRLLGRQGMPEMQFAVCAN